MGGSPAFGLLLILHFYFIVLSEKRMDEEARLTIEIRNERPVSLIDFSHSFLSLSDEFERYIRVHDEEAKARNVHLFIREVKSGSIIADLVAYAPYALPIIQEANSVIKFSEYLAAVFKFLLGKSKDKPDFKYKNLENFVGIVEPIAKDSASQYNFNTTINGNIHLHFGLNSVEANAVQNSAGREMELLKEPVSGLHEKVLLYFYQARTDPKSNVGDRVVIESIYPAPVKVIFSTDTLKARMLHSAENPFNSAYVVDVNVETINDKPMLYKIIEVHDSFERPGPEENKELFK